MRIVIGIIFSLLLIIIGVILLFLFVRTYQMQHNESSKIFLAGTVPDKLPDGFHKGNVSVKTSWQGKKFDAKNGTGINILKDGEKFPFKLYKGKGIADRDLDVIKIDYSQNTDPWWLRFVLDEIVEVKPDSYLGKVHLTFIPGVPFTIGYFELSK